MVFVLLVMDRRPCSRPLAGRPWLREFRARQMQAQGTDNPRVAGPPMSPAAPRRRPEAAQREQPGPSGQSGRGVSPRLSPSGRAAALSLARARERARRPVKRRLFCSPAKPRQAKVSRQQPPSVHVLVNKSFGVSVCAEVLNLCV